MQTEDEWMQRQAEGFQKEMERQKQNPCVKLLPNDQEKLIKPKTREEIEKMSPQEYEMYAADMRARKRRKQLQKREDASAKPGKSGGFQRIE
jgi:hypothetical protein